MGFYDELPTMSPQLIADVTLYSTVEGGIRSAKQLGWNCLCCRSKSEYTFPKSPDTPHLFGYDGWLLLDKPISPGESRRLGFVFIAGEEAADALRKVGTSYLWSGRFVGEAIVAW